MEKMPGRSKEPDLRGCELGPMRTADFRRHQIHTHMWRRLKEDRNQHYDRLDCPCWTDLKAMARFKEQPKKCNCLFCGNARRNKWNSKLLRLTLQERRQLGV